MRSRTNPGFRRAYDALPADTKALAREAYAKFLNDPFHQTLHFKQVRGYRGVWSVRIGIHHRALGRREGDRIAWFWIGAHAEYDRIIFGR